MKEDTQFLGFTEHRVPAEDFSDNRVSRVKTVEQNTIQNGYCSYIVVLDLTWDVREFDDLGGHLAAAYWLEDIKELAE